MPQNNSNQTPDAFKNWSDLFIHENQPIPEGWKNMVYADKAQAPGKALPTVDTSGSEPKIEPHVVMLNDKADVEYHPLSKVQDAIKAGLHLAAHMISPDGQHGWIPQHRIEEAKAAGFKHAK